MVLKMGPAEVTLVAQLASVLSETFLSVSFVVQQLHVPLVKNSPPELYVADVADVRLFHVRLDVTRSCRRRFVCFVAVRTLVRTNVGVRTDVSLQISLVLASLPTEMAANEKNCWEKVLLPAGFELTMRRPSGRSQPSDDAEAPLF